MPIVRIPVNITWAASGSPGVNVWHAEVPAPANEATLGGVVDALEAFYTELRSLAPGGGTYSFDGVVTDVETQSQSTVPGWTMTTAGTSNFAPLATALCISWRTGTASRSGVGRTFLGPIAAGFVETNGTPSAACLTLVRTAAFNLLQVNDAIEPGGNDGLGIYSRQTGVIRKLQSARVRDTFAVLRSRRD